MSVPKDTDAVVRGHARPPVVTKDEATAYRERWPPWSLEAFSVEPVAADGGANTVRIKCSTCGREYLSIPIDLRRDPPPTLLRELRAHMTGHGFIPTSERQR